MITIDTYIVLAIAWLVLFILCIFLNIKLNKISISYFQFIKLYDKFIIGATKTINDANTNIKFIRQNMIRRKIPIED